MTEMLEYFLILFCGSNLFFFAYTQGKVSYITVAGVILGILHSQLPM